MNTSNHILIRDGILTSFNIAKRITDDDIQKLKEILNGNNVSSEIFDSMLHQMVLNDIKESLKDCQIPGVLIEKQKQEDEIKKKFMELTYLATQMAQKLKDKNLDDYYLCYTINALVNLLDLKEEDFNEFNRRFTKFKEGLSEPEPE